MPDSTLPIAPIAIEQSGGTGAVSIWELIGKWFVFWGVGVRSLIAGARQIRRPELTATGVFGVTDKAAFPLAQELGFWNATIGLICIATIKRPDWVVPMAIARCLFYAMAGIQHATGSDRNFLENVAMASDLTMAAVLVVFLVATYSNWARGYAAKRHPPTSAVAGELCNTASPCGTDPVAIGFTFVEPRRDVLQGMWRYGR